jgi:hypothetical protein
LLANRQLQDGNHMDLSKLPKLSDTKSQVRPDADRPTPTEPSPQQVIIYRQPTAGADIWISLIIGIILCFLGGTFARYAIATLTHQPFHTGVNCTSISKDSPPGATWEFFFSG